MDFTDLLDQANTFTSNAASVVRGLVDAIERGEAVYAEKLRPLAEQLDAFAGNADDPVPAPPAGGVPVDGPVASDDAMAAAAVGVTG